ncbi:hypothetical protein ECZU01_14270 [Escherichia coli]|nr:hypothetical protein ECZU01_14270 [Escherichia coli]
MDKDGGTHIIFLRENKKYVDIIPAITVIDDCIVIAIPRSFSLLTNKNVKHSVSKRAENILIAIPNIFSSP